MSFGIPYKGSKNIYAKQICEVLPSGKRLVDLFAGGCAVTDCAMRNYKHKWESFVVNDIMQEPLDLYLKCLCGNCPVSHEWISREDFPAKDWATRLVWSFGNDTRTYLYGKDIEPFKRDIETWITDGIVLGETNILSNIVLPDISDWKARFFWWRENKKQLADQGVNVNAQRLQHLERLERLERLKRLERLERLNVSYEQYEYQDGDVVYCDIPYKDTNCKQYNDSGFNHEAFWNWAKSQPFSVYVSERVVPKDAEIVLVKEVANRANRKGIDGFKTEYLVRV